MGFGDGDWVCFVRGVGVGIGVGADRLFLASTSHHVYHAYH